jgi:TonB family protein
MADDTDNSNAKPAAMAAPSARAPKAARVHPLAAAMASAAQTLVYGPRETVGAAARSTAMSLFGSLDADERIRQNAESGERTLWIGAAAVTLLYVSLIAGQLLLGDPLRMAAEERARERRGQDATGPISVEIVAEPDLNAKTKKWRDGSEAQAPQPSDRPPQTPQMESQAQREIQAQQQQEAREQEEQEKEAEEKASSDAMLLDLESLVEAAAADLTRKIDRAYQRPQRQQPQRQRVEAGGQMKVRGRGATGKSDAFSRSVIAALTKTRPGPFAMWGNVLVAFEIALDGSLKYVRVLDSSGNEALDQAAVDAIRKARFQRPPPGLSEQQRTYVIDYVFGFG